MKWKYRLKVNASIEEIYRAMTPAAWMTFYLPHLYRGVVDLSGEWPSVGAAIRIAYGSGPVSVTIKQTIREHEPGSRICIEEDVLGGLWRDTNEICLEAAGEGCTLVTVVSDQRSGLWPLCWLGPIRWCLNWLDLRPALRRFATLVEAGSPLTAAALLVHPSARPLPATTI